MCTIMTVRETLKAELMLSATANKLVAELMAYDRRLAEPFTLEELEKLCKNKSISPEELREVLNESELQRLDQLAGGIDLSRKPAGKYLWSLEVESDFAMLSPQDKRQYWKSFFVEAPFYGGSRSGMVMVWLDGACYGNGKKGFYYVRYQDEFINLIPTTAYHPSRLIVDSRKLRGEQKLYMERKWQETQQRIKAYHKKDN